MDERLLLLADDALAAARAAGADFAEVRAVEELSEAIDVRDDRVEGVARTSSAGVGIRVLSRGAWGFAGTNDPAGVRAAAERAVAIARASAGLRPEAVRLDDTPPPGGTYVTPHERNPFDVPLAEKIDLLLATTAAGREAAGVAYVEATTDAWQRTTIFRSSEGGWFDQRVLQVGGGMRGTAVGEGELQRRSYPNSFRGQFTCGGWEDVTRLDLPAHALGTCREAVALLTAPELPSRETTLLLESSQLALQVHESVGHPTELDRIMGMERAFAGTSWVAVEDRGTLRYGSPLVTIVADATTPGALGTFGFDDEGVPAGTAPIVTNGVLEGFLTSRETAALLGERSNGTARADSWGAIPLIRMNNVSLQPGDGGSLDDLVADTDDGVYLATNRSWSIDDKRLNFQFGCEAAYEIRHGRLGRLYRNPTYSGRTPVFWNACDALGSDFVVWGVPNCGKGQPMQTARVAHGSPTGRFHGVATGARP
ncbi:MAG TPA: TldD/PmbA family protein [Frankiaceae bacterium]|jgi:TldD protein|nr:TldD/PmbA family protein [Frankiaceae bacterium]